MDILALHLSPKKNGNSAIMLDEFIKGAQKAGAKVTDFRVSGRNLKHCTGCASCEKTGLCVIKDDDMSEVYPLLTSAPAIVVSTSLYFYDVPSIGKALIDRTQPLWSRRYALKQSDALRPNGRGYLLALGATNGKDLFEPVSLSVKYFFDAIGYPKTFSSMFFRKIEGEKAFEQDPDRLRQVYEAGMAFANANLSSGPQGCS